MVKLISSASRVVALERLAQFAPKGGVQYASGRNTDYGPDYPSAVSRLSPYLRYRLITEQETVASVLSQHSPAAAEKFVQEVLWRTYWKGWLEMRPTVWQRFLDERDLQRHTFRDSPAVTDAGNGLTGIEGFDDWARELVATGYLHNHARMWFASIWIFTLRLPWALGADFFLRHLIDADAASNTLSWRWVAGLQTVGKTYLATAGNIARYTNGRFTPKGLAAEAIALTEAPIAAPQELPALPAWVSRGPAALLVTHDDLNPETLFDAGCDIRSVIVAADAGLLWGDGARQFVRAAAADTAARAATHFGCPVNLADKLSVAHLIAAAREAGVGQIITPYAPVGPVADVLAKTAPELAREGIALVQARRAWDSVFWPHAGKGFFAFKERIPSLLRESSLT
jgi:deoxyribodipyrimidine photo-lyase